MKKTTIFIFLNFTLFFYPPFVKGGIQKNLINVLHYNIKELDSRKIREKDQSLMSSIKLLKEIPFDILSLNEIQYDFPGIPYESFITRGQNLVLIGQLLGGSLKGWPQLFHPGNTGVNARKRDDGTYFPDLKKLVARSYADPINFGVFPGQYATGGVSRFPVKEVHYIHKIIWKDAFPKRVLSSYKDAHGNPLPKNMPLFDKVFIHATLDVKGQDLHLILLHTVPSFNFGNQNSVNIVRNSDQLRFLKSYLEGKRLGSESNSEGLPLNAPFIVMGDLNVDYRDSKKEGALVMKSLLESKNIKGLKVDHTYESEGFAKRPNKLLLDYILYGGQGLSLNKGGVYGLPSGKVHLGCKKPRLPMPGKVMVSYKKRGKSCFLEMNKPYFLAKKASDHFPLYAQFSLEKEL